MYLPRNKQDFGHIYLCFGSVLFTIGAAMRGPLWGAWPFCLYPFNICSFNIHDSPNLRFLHKKVTRILLFISPVMVTSLTLQRMGKNTPSLTTPISYIRSNEQDLAFISKSYVISILEAFKNLTLYPTVKQCSLTIN